MRKGVITHIDPFLGKGFIEDENGQDIFFDLELIQSDINAGDLVNFQIILGSDGLVASDVQQMVKRKEMNLSGMQQ